MFACNSASQSNAASADPGDIRRADEQILGQAFDRPEQILGRHHPADAPSGHRKIFGKAIREYPVCRAGVSIGAPGPFVALPQQPGRVTGESTVSRDDGHVLGECLPDQEPVHRVFVVRRQTRGDLGMTHADRQLDKAV